MNSSHCSYTEQEIIDFTLNQLPLEKMEEMTLHFKHCETCSKHVKEWGAVFEAMPQGPENQPSKTLKRRIKISYMFRHVLPAFLRRPAFTIPAVGTATIILLLAGLFSLQTTLPATDQANGMTHEMSMVMDPKTVQYNVTPVTPSDAKGYVWINRNSQEMLFLIKGIAPISEKDYQVWFISKQARSKGGLLHWKNGMGHFYVHGGEIEGVENIAVSIEPKGGSKAPTSPDAMFVDLKNNVVR